MELDHNCTKAYGTRTYLHKGVQNCQGQEDHSSKGSRQQHDDEDLHQLEKVVQHHLQSFGYHAINGINLFSEAVQQIATGRRLKEGHGGVEHIIQEVHVQVA